MDIKQIEKLARIMQDTGLTRLSISENDMDIELERSTELNNYLRHVIQDSQAASVGIIGSSDGPTSILTSESDKAAAKEEGRFVSSPTVGVFYASPSPDSDPFVQVGSKVSKGDVVCIIEAMKLMNEITCEFDGTVAEICVGNGQTVEYGQPLFRIV